jgi:integrase
MSGEIIPQAHGKVAGLVALWSDRICAQALKDQPVTTEQGRRDTLIMCLLLDHGLRLEEVAILTAKALDMKAGTITFYRPKVNKVQTHTMTPDTRNAARVYLKHAPADKILWRKSSKGTGKLGEQLSETSATRAINKRVELLGRHAGIEGLSPHDCRHYAATFEARKGTPIDQLVDSSAGTRPLWLFATSKPRILPTKEQHA